MKRSIDFDTPQIPPITTPITTLIKVAIKEMIIELRAPNQTPSNKDLPLLSVPKKALALGGFKRAVKSFTLLTSL